MEDKCTHNDFFNTLFDNIDFQRDVIFGPETWLNQHSDIELADQIIDLADVNIKYSPHKCLQYIDTVCHFPVIFIYSKYLKI